MVDNFFILEPLLNFSEPGDFYFIQILQRKKENPELKHSQRLIKSYFVYSIEELEHRKEEMVKLCDMFNARCYIAINKRNDEKVALMTLKDMAEAIANKDYGSIKSAYLSACGRYSSDSDKKWVIDYDSKDEDKLNDMIGFVNSIEPACDRLKGVIPTKNGYHIIVKPFNKVEFSKVYNGDDIKKDNYTVLYCP